MKHFIQIIFYSCPILFITSCAAPSFLPQTHNVPLFTEKNQLRVNSTVSIKTFDFQVAYSPIKHLGIITNLQLCSHYTMAEIGVGAFQSYGERLVTELYLGYGNGYLKTDYQKKSNILAYDYDYYNIDINANKYFFQPNIGINFNEKINLSLSTKFTYWDYSHYNFYHEQWIYDSGSYFMKGTDSLYSNRNCSATTLEPALTFRVGGEHTKFMLQTGFCSILNSGGTEFYPYGKTYTFIRLGVCVNFDLFEKKE